jgi:FAD/FMN-containing dehydrogenase
MRSEVSSREVSNLLARLGGEIDGTVVDRTHPDWDRRRRVWNAMFDDRRPFAIIRCATEQDVVTTVRRLRDTGLPVAVRGGGHHIAGFGTCDSGIVIDLGGLRGTRLVGSRMYVEGGALLHDVDVAGAASGCAVPLGVVSPTGVAGLTLSGGVGWLTRRHGYTCDNLVAARVVTADGTLVVASESDNADLLWGLRGGGGNFGIVTRFEFLTHPIGPVVVGEAYHLVSDSDQTARILRFYREWTAELDRDTTVWLAIEDVNPDYDLLWPEHAGELVVGLLACCAKPDLDAGERTLAPMTKMSASTASRVTRMAMVDLQHLQDESGAAATGMRNYMKGEMMTELTDQAVSGIADHAHRMPTPNSLFEMGLLGGAIGDLPDGHSAVGLREAQYLAGFSLMSATDERLAEHIAWTREAWSVFLDASAGGAYLNFNGEEEAQRVLASLGADQSDKRDRLVALKRHYDPTNFFRINHNIDPDLESA